MPLPATATLDDLDRAEAEILQRLNGGGKSLREFICEQFPHEPPPPHLDPLIEAIERARHQKVKILLSMPPGHAKTVTFLRAIVWWLKATPADTCAYLSYSDMQAWGKSKVCRGVAEDAGLALDPEFTAAAEWRTEEHGGLLAAGVDGRLTGNRVTGFAVVDDPFKSMKDASSATVREAVWSWFTTVVKTRLQDASVIVVHTRWHPDDLIGRLEAQGGWEVINLPALAENDNGRPDILGRAPGEALWPEMYPANDLTVTKREIGEFNFAALYQGRPRAAGAKVFRTPARFDLKTFDRTGCVFAIGVDPAATKNTTGDWSVAVLMAMRRRPGKLPIFYLLAMLRRQVSVPTFVKLLRVFQVTHGNAKAFVESVAGFKAVPQMLEEIEGSLLVDEVIPHGDKFQRAQPAAAACNDEEEQRLLIPYETDETTGDLDLEVYQHELKEFTGVDDPVDDQVDATSTAFNALVSEPEPPKYESPPAPTMPRRRTGITG